MVVREAHYDVHHRYADRCKLLADQLHAVTALSEIFRYAAALAVLRTALEHHMLDLLIFLGDRWLSTYQVKPAQVEEIQAKLASRRDVVSVDYERKTGKLNVVLRGLFDEKAVGSGPTVSRYFFAIQEYDPFTVNPKLMPDLALGFRDPDLEKGWAEQSLDNWYRLFTFGRLRDNIALNGLLPPDVLLQLEVHHSFLSAYVHGVQRAYEAVYGSRRAVNIGRYDHYDSELCWLYVIALAAAELVAFGQISSHDPRLELRDWSTVETEIEMARAAGEHLWFLSGGPSTYDRIQEIETRFPKLDPPLPLRPVVDLASLEPSEIRYYTHPLRRLIGLHGSYHELMTGIAYESPFHRADARQRGGD